GRVSHHLARDVELLVGVEIHEDVVRAVTVEVLHVLPLDDREAHLHTRVERPLQHSPGLDVAQLRTDECAALPGLHVLELDDLEECAVEVEGHAVLEVVGGDAHRTPYSSISSRVDVGITRQPSSVTSTMSSILTPPTPGT